MDHITILDFIIFCLAAYRINHFLVFDKVFEPVRRYFVVRNFIGPLPTFTLQGGFVRRFIGKILICHWCAGIWTAGALTVGLWAVDSIMWLYNALAAAAVLSLIETCWTKAVGFPEMIERREP